MTLKHHELAGSRVGTDANDRTSEAELIFAVYDSANAVISAADCRSYLSTNAVIPTTYDGLVYRSLSWENAGGSTQWIFTAHYVHPDSADQNETLDVGDYTWGFDTGGDTVHRTNSYSTTKYAKSGETAPDFKGAINVVIDQGERRVEGLDHGVSGLHLWVRKRIATATITLAWVKTIKDLTYKYNNGSYLGFDAGEMLFIGATGQQGINTDPEVTFNFIVSENVTSLQLGDITGIAKLGHDYLWCLYEDLKDDTAKETVKQLKACYVEQVFKPASFSALGIA